MAVKKKLNKAAPTHAKAKVKVKPKPAPRKSALKAKPAAKAVAKKKPAVKAVAPAKAVPKDFHSRITPLDDRIVVAPDEALTTSESGLILSVSGSARPNRGLVLALGRGRRGKKGQVRPLDVKRGDRVLYAEYAGTTLKIDDVEVLILREEEILGIVDVP